MDSREIAFEAMGLRPLLGANFAAMAFAPLDEGSASPLLGGASTDIRSTDFRQRSRLNGLQRALPHREEECRRWASTAIEDALACARVPGGTGWDNGQRGE